MINRPVRDQVSVTLTIEEIRAFGGACATVEGLLGSSTHPEVMAHLALLVGVRERLVQAALSDGVTLVH